MNTVPSQIDIIVSQYLQTIIDMSARLANKALEVESLKAELGVLRAAEAEKASKKE